MSTIPSQWVPTPTEADARRIVEQITGLRVERVVRFPTGLAHHVYDVTLVDGGRLVARLTRPNAYGRSAFAGAVYWSGRLRSMGVPLPELLYADADGDVHGFPTLLLERLPGTDLGHVYAGLTAGERRAIAHAVAAIGRRVTALPLGLGYGYAFSYDDPGLFPSWRALLHHQLGRDAAHLRAAGLFDLSVVERVRSAGDRLMPLLDAVPPVPFLDDTTTKNVIVDGGRLSGIVDVDVVCFGDALYTPALTRAALIGSGDTLDYIDAWTETLELDADAQVRLDLYTARCCVGLLSGMGNTFNGPTPEPFERARAERLLTAFDRLLPAQCGR